MTADREKAKDKVAKLMAMANDSGASAQEAETAMRQAEKLMRKHAIDLAEVMDTTGQKPIYEWDEGLVPVGWPKPVKGQPLWLGWIGSAIGKFTDTRVQWAWGNNQSYLKFQGTDLDVAYAVWLGNHIRNEVRIRANTYDAPGNSSDERWANREEFRHQMAMRICDRLQALRAERDIAMRGTSTGTALVLVTDKIAQRDEQFGVQRYSKGNRSFTRGSYEAAIHGREAGNKVQFGRPVTGNETKKLS